MIRCLFDHLSVFLQHASPAADLLTEADGDRILQMSPADLDDVHVLLFQPLQGLCQLFQRRIEIIPDGEDRGHVHGRGEGIVGGLGHIDMIVGMDLKAQMIVHADMGNDFVGIHVGLGAAAGLPYLQGKFSVILSLQDIAAGTADGLAPFRVQSPQLLIGAGCRPLEGGKGTDHLHGNGLRADGKVLKAPLGLGAPEMFCGDFYLAHGVVFDSVFHWGLLTF